MSRRHAARRRQRGEELDRNRRARILGADGRRMRLVAVHVSALRPQRPLYRMKAKAMGRRFTNVVVRLTADVRGLVGACMQASAAVNRFGEAARAWESRVTGKSAEPPSIRIDPDGGVAVTGQFPLGLLLARNPAVQEAVRMAMEAERKAVIAHAWRFPE